MKVSFLMPPDITGRGVDRCYGCNYGIYFLPHLPSLYCVTVLRDAGFNVSIMDFDAKRKSQKEFERYIERDNSDVYVFYTVFLTEETDKRARDKIRGCNKEAKFIFCGTQPTWRPQNFVDDKSFVVRGEPELTVLKVVKNIDNPKKVKGVSYFDGILVNNPPAKMLGNLDSLPIPDRTLLNHESYFNPKMKKTPHTAMLTSRGCFGKCTYCVPNSLSFSQEIEHKSYTNCKPKPRLHSVERVINEFKNIQELGFKSVSIIDDNFVWGEKRALEICDGIKDLGIEWSCLTRPDTITNRVAEAMANSGCIYVDLGIESFNQKILDAVKKNMDVKTIRSSVEILKKYGVEPELNVLFGATPIETEESIRKTIDEVESLDVDYVLYNIAAPFPGTEFYYEAMKKGWMTTDDYVPIDPSKETITNYKHLSKEKLEELLKYAYKRHYMNPKYVLRQLSKVDSISDFKNKTKTAFNLIKRNFT